MLVKIDVLPGMEKVDHGRDADLLRLHEITLGRLGGDERAEARILAIDRAADVRSERVGNHGAVHFGLGGIACVAADQGPSSWLIESHGLPHNRKYAHAMHFRTSV